MRQVRDTLIWLAMILVVAGALNVTPRVANYVAAATGSEHGPACVTCSEVTLSHHAAFTHHHH